MTYSFVNVLYLSICMYLFMLLSSSLFVFKKISSIILISKYSAGEGSGSVVECLTRDRGDAGSSVTAL